MNDGEAIQLAIQMQKEGKPVWLIERGQPENQSPTVWWAGCKDGRGSLHILEGWTANAHEAKPFPTRQIAEQFINDRSHPTRGPSERAVEHIFVPFSRGPVGKRPTLLPVLRQAIVTAARKGYEAQTVEELERAIVAVCKKYGVKP